jgi:hypothetical protein
LQRAAYRGVIGIKGAHHGTPHLEVNMGLVWRLLAPKPLKKARRSVRKATHPVRTVRRAATPAPIRGIENAAWKAANPISATKLMTEDAIVHSMRGGKKGPRSRTNAGTRKSSPAEGAAHDVSRQAPVGPPEDWLLSLELFEPASRFVERTAALKQVRAELANADSPARRFELLTVEHGLVSRLYDEFHQVHARGNPLAQSGQIDFRTFQTAILSFNSFLANNHVNSSARKKLWGELEPEVRKAAQLRGEARLETV